MKLGPISFIDQKERNIILRSAEPSDAELLLHYLRMTAAETPYLIREPDEITLTLEQEEAFISRVAASEKDLMLIAVTEGRHIGNCSLSAVGPFRRYAHRCEVAIALYRAYCGAGIGTRMLQTVLDIASELGYEQAELEVVSTNKNALALYRKAGFMQYGELPNNMKYADGTYADVYWMMKKLRPAE